ncbi:MAG: ATP-binding protein [Halohasta sp.]
MIDLSQFTQTSLFGGYILAFGAAAVACFASLGRATEITNDDTRRGLVALLVTSGLWAAFHVGYLAAPTPPLQYGFYMAGLVVGLATVGPWLYFCSAYTGRTLHRNRTYRRVAVGTYLSIVAVKLTNPMHGLYFTSETVSQPFPHLLIDHGVLHWVAMGLAYSLALIGIFMLFELFAQVDYDTTPFAVLVGLTGLPVVLDVAAFVSPALLDVTYSALGVAVFAIGVLFIYTDRFQTIQLAGQYDDPVIVLDDEGRIRDYNPAAEALFPELDGAIDEELTSVVPRLAVCLTTGETLESGVGDDRSYYNVSVNHFGSGSGLLGQLILLQNVTDNELYRREIEAQNARLEQFTGMVSHDLRNPLNIAQGHIDIARERADDASLDTVKNALDRMEALIEDLLALARQGQPIDETERVSLAEVARSSWGMVDVDDAELVVDGEIEFEADPDRLRQLFENLFRNSVEHSSTGSRTESGDSVEHSGETVTISVGPLNGTAGFYVEDTGPGIPEDKQADIFESGYTTSDHGTGFGLSIVKEIVDAHDWSISVTDGETEGARFEIEFGTQSRDETPDTSEPNETGEPTDEGADSEANPNVDRV